MIKNYTSCTALLFLNFILMASLSFGQAKMRIVDPASGDVTITNFSPSATVDMSGWWLCNFPAYTLLADQSPTGSLILAPGEEVTVSSTVGINPTDAELGLFNTNSFGSAAAMEDYIQWGSAGHQRESVAVTAGIWGAGTFIMDAPPFEYTGDGLTEFGVNFWQSALSISDTKIENAFRLVKNPVDQYLELVIAPGIIKYELTIFDINGRQITSQSLNNLNSESPTSVESMSKGIYFAELRSEKLREIIRFIKE